MTADILSVHATFAALMALLQWVGFMPLLWPWLAPTALGRQLGFVPALGLGMCLGLLANFQTFFFAVAVGQGSLPAWALPTIAAALTFVAWAWLVRRFRHVHLGMPATPAKGRWYRHALAIAAVAIALALLAQDIARGVPGVFEAWDALVSWNRWATEWHRHVPPIYTMGYPQLLPTALAGLYGWIDPDAAQPVARLFILLFPVLPCLLLVDGYRRWRDDAFLWGCAAWLVLLRFAFRGMADSGYADVPVACFVSLTAYLLLLGYRGSIDRSMALTLAAIAAAAALLTKQPGGIAWLWWLGAAAAMWLRRQVPWSSIAFKALLFLALAAPWYLYTAWRIRMGVDVTNIGYLVGIIHADRNWIQRIGHALQGPLMDAFAGFGSATTAAGVVTVLLAMACMRVDGRRLVLGLCLPYLLLWASLFSYDSRNLLPVMVPVALALGFGVQWLLDQWDKVLPVTVAADGGGLVNWPLSGVGRWMSFGVLTVAAVLAWVAPWSIEDFRHRQHSLQQAADDPALNRYLLDYARDPGFGGLVLTTYAPMLMMEELRRHTPPLTDNPNLAPVLSQALVQGRPWCELQAISPRFSQIRYLLLHRFLLLPMIEASQADGSLRIVHEQGALRLMRVGCPSIDAKD